MCAFFPPVIYYSTEDADLVNDTWKYKSEESIHMVKNTEQYPLCVCLFSVQHIGTSND